MKKPMKTLPLLLLLYFCYSRASIVLQLPQTEHVTLTLDSDIELSNTLSFCARFNLFGKQAHDKHIICSDNGHWCFILRLALNHGFVTLNGHDLIFEVPNGKGHPHAWYHFCFSSDESKYQVIYQHIINTVLK